MKALLLSLSLLFAGSLAARSQDVFQAVQISAQDVLDNPSSDDIQLQIAQFKLTALTYMHRKMIERDPETPALELDTQAYYLSVFVTKFLADVCKHSNDDKKVRNDAAMLFIRSSVDHPLFNDPDVETTHAFISDGDNIMQFSLDTDWKAACSALGFE